MKKLQLALDDVMLEEGLRLVEKLEMYVDIIEIGTPFILREGMRAVREFRRLFPEKELLADTKIMDAGEFEAELAYEAGADYCTVLGVTDTRTVLGCLRAAEKYGKQFFVDMICVQNAAGRVRELEAAGVKHISVHTGVDQQAAGRTPLDDLALLRSVSERSEISVAGGINAGTVGKYIAGGADIVIVGGGIVHADNPLTEARAICQQLKGID